jgi:hypothetical protein
MGVYSEIGGGSVELPTKKRINPMRTISATNHDMFRSALLALAHLVEAAQKLYREAKRPAEYPKGYLPERHYMRGPGPATAYREAHGD